MPMPTRLIELTEWTEAPSVRLCVDELKLLQRAVPDLQTKLEDADLYTLRSASNKVGVVELDGLTVRISPSKCSPSLVVFMMGYSSGAAKLADNTAGFDSGDEVWETMVRVFSHQLGRALRTGVYRGYRCEEDALPTIRGRIRIDDQLRSRYRLAPPIEVAFDDYTDDITENRILRAAISRCHQLRVRSKPLVRELRHHEAHLTNVLPMEFNPARPPHITWTRLNEHLRPAVELGLLILKNTSISLGDGTNRSPGFLVDMADVFEDFVVAGLRDALGLDERSFPQGDRRLRLADDVTLEPDFSWWDSGECVAIGDVKYKATSASGVLHPDLYQVFAYATAARLAETTLVYARSKGTVVGREAARTHHVTYAGKKLRVEVLDLDHGPGRALEELSRISRSLSLSRHPAAV
jgi:5-methylcytosine-specific restriction enzyme subunit McrC